VTGVRLGFLAEDNGSHTLPPHDRNRADDRAV